MTTVLTFDRAKVRCATIRAPELWKRWAMLRQELERSPAPVLVEPHV